MAPLRWNRGQSYTGVVYHTMGWVLAGSTCILGYQLREEGVRNIELWLQMTRLLISQPVHLITVVFKLLPE